jgi:hypothetical protein
MRSGFCFDTPYGVVLVEIDEVVVSIAFPQKHIYLENEEGLRIPCVLKPLNGEQRNAYLEFVDKMVVRDAKGDTIGMKTWKGSNTKLLSLTLYRAKLDDLGKPLVSDGRWAADKLWAETELTKYPDEALQTMTKLSIGLSKLNEKPEQAGND